METTKEQLEAIEGIDSEMAVTIVDARTSKIIDLNFVYSITSNAFSFTSSRPVFTRLMSCCNPCLTSFSS
jgi:hypothetical protein